MLQKVPKAAPRNGPERAIRFQSKKDLDTIKRAAKELNLSVNTFVIESALRSAQETLNARSGNQEGEMKATA